MNANELADWLETIKGYPAIQAWGNKLRQLQAEINELKAKTLTDEEIEECYWGDGYPEKPRNPKEFARAILRKASEK